MLSDPQGLLQFRQISHTETRESNVKVEVMEKNKCVHAGWGDLLIFTSYAINAEDLLTVIFTSMLK